MRCARQAATVPRTGNWHQEQMENVSFLVSFFSLFFRFSLLEHCKVAYIERATICITFESRLKTVTFVFLHPLDALFFCSKVLNLKPQLSMSDKEDVVDSHDNNEDDLIEDTLTQLG